MAWIESHQTLREHPKTKKAARLLKIGRVAIIGHLHCLWWWALDYAPSGDVTPFSDVDLADAAEWDGEPAEFINALLNCGIGNKPGFLEVTEDGRRLIHDWWVYAGKLLSKRQANAQRMKDARAGHVQDTCDARAGATNQPTDQQTEPTVTVPTNSKEEGTSKDSTSLVAYTPFATEPELPPCPGCLKHSDTHKKYLAQCQRLDFALGHTTMSSSAILACREAADTFCATVAERDIAWCKPHLSECYRLLIEPRLKREIDNAVLRQSPIRNRKAWAQTWLKETLAAIPHDGEFYSTVGYRAKGRAMP